MIQNLHTAGTIYTSGKYASGIAGTQYGTVKIENCRSSVTIISSTSGDGTHGGFIGLNGNSVSAKLTIEGCVFDGKILSVGETATTSCSGFVGYHSDKGTVTISNSMYAPAAVGTGETEVASGATFVRNWSGTPTNCYYTRSLGNAQGKAAHTVTAGENVMLSLSGTATEYNVSGITAYSTGLAYDGNIYAGNDDEVALTLGNTTPDGYIFKGYSVNAGTLADGTLTMPDEAVTVSAEFLQKIDAKAPTYTESGNIEYYIGSDGKYYTNDGTAYSETTAAAVTIDKLTMFMQVDPHSGSSGNVDINIYVPLPDDADMTKDTYTLVFGSKEFVVGADTSKRENDGRDYYQLRIAAPAKEMADTLTYSVKKNGEVIEGTTGTTSVRNYVDIVINGSSSDSIKKTCRAMLAYGAAAQTYFNHNTSSLANADISGEGADYSGVVLNMGEAFDMTSLNSALSTANAPVEYYGMNMTLDSDTYINLFFEVKSGTQADAITYINSIFTLDGKAVAAEANEVKQFVVVRSPAISIDNLLKNLVLTYGSDNYTVNVKQYMTLAYNSGSENLKNVCKALYNYYLAASKN